MYLKKSQDVVGGSYQKWSFQANMHKMRFCQVFCKERCL